jgi:uncharacterized protein (UPF0335 family)
MHHNHKKILYLYKKSKVKCKEQNAMINLLFEYNEIIWVNF